MGNHLTEMAPTTSFLPHFQALHVVVIGLDSAGKTSLLYRLKFKEFVQRTPSGPLVNVSLPGRVPACRGGRCLPRPPG